MVSVSCLLLLAIGLFAAEAHSEEPVLPLITSLLKGGAEGNRALERLRFIGPEKAGPPLRAMLETGDERTRIAVSSALILIRDPASAQALQKRLQEDSDWEVRQNSALALGELKHLPAAKTLSSRLISDPHRRVRRACAIALGKLGLQPRALLAAAGTDDSLEVQLAALDSLRHMAKEVAPGLRKLLNDDSALLRFAAARALAYQKDAKAKEFLEAQLVAEAESQRRAVTVLVDLEENSWSTALLLKALECEDADARLDAATALARRGREEGVRGLLDFVNGAPGIRSRMAASTLAQLGYEASDFVEKDAPASSASPGRDSP